MSPEEITPLFSIRGLRARVKGNEVQVESCVFCGNPKFNLEVNPVSGVYHCWACGARGRADQFIREHLGKDFNISVNLQAARREIRSPIGSPSFVGPVKSDSVFNYLAKRGLDGVDLNVYSISEGFGEEIWEGRVIFPLWEYWSRQVIGYMGRKIAGGGPKYFSYWVDGHKYITGYQTRSDTHVIVEGAFDGVKVHKAGFNAVVLGGVTGTQVEEFAARVNPEHTLVVLLDGDAEDEANKLFWTLYPIHLKSFRVRLPVGIDPGSLDPETLSLLVRRSVQCSSTVPPS